MTTSTDEAEREYEVALERLRSVNGYDWRIEENCVRAWLIEPTPRNDQATGDAGDEITVCPRAVLSFKLPLERAEEILADPERTPTSAPVSR